MARNLRRDLPLLAGLAEIFHQQLDRQPALHLELAVEAGLGALEHLAGDIGGEDLDPPAGERARHAP